MKYDAYIKNNNLVLKPQFHESINIPINNISEFTIDKTSSGSTFGGMINGKPFFLHHTYKKTKGNLVIGLKNGITKEIYKRNFKKVISKYEFIRVKNIDDVYGLAEKLVDLGIHYDDVVYKEVKKYDLEGNVIYNCTRFFYNKV